MISKSIIDPFIHPKLMQTALSYSRAKTTVICGCIALFTIPFYSILFFSLQSYLGSLIVSIAGIIIFSSILLLRVVGSLVLSRELMNSAIFCALAFLTYNQGGIFSPPGYWLVLVPMIAIFLGGRKSGILWASISLITILGLYALQALHFKMPVTPISNVLLLQVIDISMLLIVMYLLAYFFELWKIEGFKKLEEALDLTQQKSDALFLANQELKALSTKINAILIAAADGIITTDVHGHITTSNPVISHIFGYQHEELLGKKLNLLIKDNLPKNILSLHDKYEHSHMFEVTGVRKNGSLFPLEISISKVSIHKETLTVFIMRDITERKESEKRLAYLAHYDQLTGLPNRLLFEDLLKNSIKKAEKHGSHVALLYLDLDNFKTVNNTLGHDIGDLFLNAVAKRFAKYAHENDFICRLSGDEFLFILDDMHEINNATITAHNIIEDLKNPIQIKGYQVTIGASIGIAVYPNNGKDVVTLTKNADIAMYQAKANGRNNFQYFDEVLNKQVMSQIILEKHLLAGLHNKEFFLVYQPQYDLLTNQIIGIEALIRWKNPVLGLIKPDAFIPTAEKIGIINAIGEWVLKEACRQFKEWQDKGFIYRKTKIAINLSIMQMKQSNFLEKVIETLVEVNINPKSVELELTESMIMDDPHRALILLEKISALGITIAIDDFGTGYSSLSRLKQFPVHILKIDKSFLYDLSVSRDNASIIKSIISLAHGLGLTVVAEGVETPEQLLFLKENDCDYVQGFYFSQPLTKMDMEALLQKSKTPLSS